MNTIVVTRHLDLITLLEERGLIDATTPRIDHTDDIEDVRGKDVIGVVPGKLAIFANSVTEVQLTIPRDKRGQELPIEELRQYAGPTSTYEVRQIETRTDFSDVLLTTLSTTFIQYVVRQGIVERRGAIHMDAVNRKGPTTKQDVLGKAVLGHLPYHLAQYAQDVSSIGLYYEYNRRGKVHSFEEMSSYQPELFTYRVVKIK